MARTPITSNTPAKSRTRRRLLNERHKIRVEIPQDDGFHYRVANANGDNGFRVQNLQAIGYEAIPHGEAARVGDESVDKPSAMGSNDLSLGRGDKGVLMRISKEYYNEDLEDKAELTDQQDQTMNDSARAGADYGGISIEVTR